MQLVRKQVATCRSRNRSRSRNSRSRNSRSRSRRFSFVENAESRGRDAVRVEKKRCCPQRALIRVFSEHPCNTPKTPLEFLEKTLAQTLCVLSRGRFQRLTKEQRRNEVDDDDDDDDEKFLVESHKREKETNTLYANGITESVTATAVALAIAIAVAIAFG
uniref:Uncharacterized protein n=1 Tax=Vespula pensylvanica TaxID=30213 RepID=A0A834P3M2_VESPE|nr:hypothetical protein H0235_006827 [Vespula pensylvanica]